MGIFDFLFGRNKKKASNSQSPKEDIGIKKTVRKPSYSPKPPRISETINFDPEWTILLEEMINEDQSSERPIYQLRASNTLSEQLILKMKKGHLCGIGKYEGVHSDFSDKHSSGNFIHAYTTLMTLADKTGKKNNEQIKIASKGIVKLSAKETLNTNKNAHYSITSTLRTLSSSYKDPYLASLFLEQLGNDKIYKKLHALLQFFVTARPEDLLPITEEIIEVMKMNQAPYELGGINLFKDPDALISYLDLRHNQQHAERIDGKLQQRRIRLFDECLEKHSEHIYDHFFLFLYENLSTYKADELDKYMQDKYLKTVSKDYHFIHKMLDIIISHSDYSSMFGTSFILKIIKSYFKNEPLDLSTYDKLCTLMSKADTLSRMSSINSFLYSMKDRLYQIPNPEFFAYKHTGVLHLSTYYTKSEKAKHHNNLISLISQVCNAYMLHETDHENTVRIGEQEIKISRTPNGKINEALYSQKIPYQLVDIYHFPQSRMNTGVKNTILLTENELYTLSSKIHESNKDRYPNWNKSLRFVTISGKHHPIENNLKKAKIKQTSSIKENAFLHDIKWKNLKNNVIDQFSERRTWYTIMHNIVSHPNSVSPSKTWLKSLDDSLNTIESDAFAQGHARLVGQILEDDFWMAKSNLKALRGVIWSATKLPEEKALKHIEVILRTCYEKIPGIGPKSISGGSSCMSALLDINTANSYNVLVRLRDNTSYERFRNQLDDWIIKFEKTSGATVSSLKESSTDDFSFVNGSKILEVQHPHYIQWTIKNRKAKSQWIDAQGNKQNKAPQIDLPNIKKSLTATTKSINEAIEQFDERMESYTYGDIRWSVSEWKKNYSEHEFIRLVIDNYLWIVHHTDGSISSIMTQNGKYFDYLYNEVLINDDNEIRPYHPTLITDEARNRWKELFIKHKIQPHVDYFYSCIFTLEEFPRLLKMYQQMNIHFYFNGRGWLRVDTPAKDRSIYAKELILLGKVVTVSKIHHTDTTKTPYEINYYNLPSKRKKKSQYSLSELGDPISSSEIPNHVQSTIAHKIEYELYKKSVSARSTLNTPFYKELPNYILMNKIYTKIDQEGVFSNLSYIDGVAQIKGTLHNYEFNILSNYVIKQGQEQNKGYNNYHTGIPKKNYLNTIGIPIKAKNDLIAQIWLIEQLNNDSKIKHKMLKNWIDRD